MDERTVKWTDVNSFVTENKAERYCSFIYGIMLKFRVSRQNKTRLSSSSVGDELLSLSEHFFLVAMGISLRHEQ